MLTNKDIETIKIADISTNTYSDNSFKNISLTYTKTFEEEMKEQELISIAENYLENMGIQIKSNYGYYRNSYAILKDLGEYLSNKNT